MDRINIRDINGVKITAPIFQTDATAFHTDSSEHRCEFDARSGCIPNEDNFGVYVNINRAFRCTESDESTTQYWFGAHV